MKIIVGHGNMDLDCVASIVLARYLFPDHVPVRSSLVQPAARNLLNLYSKRLDFSTAADLKGEVIERMVVVDARSPDQVAEFLKATEGAEVEIFDHHPRSGRDIHGAFVHDKPLGANASQLVLELASRGISIHEEDATIALAGIYADTDNFTHPNVRVEDFQAATWLLARGASLGLVKDLLVPLRDPQQFVLFHEIIGRLERRSIRGRAVLTCYMELDEDSQGMGAVVERVFEVENGEVLFAFFHFKPKGKLLIIARNSAKEVRLNEILADFGGGGHAQAASATVKTLEGRALAERIVDYLERALEPAPTAGDIMTAAVSVLDPESSLLEASKYLEGVSHTGAPVVGADGRVRGFLTLRDIMKGRKAGQMQAPVKTYMSPKLVSASPSTTLREIDELLFQHNIGHLPVLESGRLVGIVTRSDFLEYRRDERTRRAGLLQGMGVAGSA